MIFSSTDWQIKCRHQQKKRKVKKGGYSGENAHVVVLGYMAIQQRAYQ